jgi:hypothetical protein
MQDFFGIRKDLALHGIWKSLVSASDAACHPLNYLLFLQEQIKGIIIKGCQH